jgi:hypothetical protein
MIHSLQAPSRSVETPFIYPNLSAGGDGDIMAIAFIVMMEAAKSAREDLKTIMDGVRKVNKEKPLAGTGAQSYLPSPHLLRQETFGPLAR